MTTYQYKERFVPSAHDGREFERITDLLNEEGRHGWRYVEQRPVSGGTAIRFEFKVISF